MCSIDRVTLVSNVPAGLLSFVHAIAMSSWLPIEDLVLHDVCLTYSPKFGHGNLGTFKLYRKDVRVARQAALCSTSDKARKINDHGPSGDYYGLACCEASRSLPSVENPEMPHVLAQ